MGMNMAKVALDRMDPARRDALIESGVLSPLARIRPFAPLDQYPPDLTDVAVPDVPVLREVHKPSGWANYNHYAYIGIAKQFARDSLAAMRAAPDEALHEMTLGLKVFVLPSTDYWFLEPNRSRIPALDHAFDVFFQGTITGCAAARPLRARVDGEDYFAADYLACNRSDLWIGYIAIGLAGSLAAAVLWLRRRGASGPWNPAWAATLVYMGFTIAFVSVVGNAFELGENNRFRYEIDPLIWTLAIATVTAAVRALIARRRPRLRDS
jgi:hypothetical protein